MTRLGVGRNNPVLPESIFACHSLDEPAFSMEIESHVDFSLCHRTMPPGCISGAVPFGIERLHQPRDFPLAVNEH